jgi:hypothetical protein
VTLFMGKETAEQACERVLEVMQEAASSMRNLV